MIRQLLLTATLVLAAGCERQVPADQPAKDGRVEASGKLEVKPADVPADVLAAARERAPDLTVVSAESETRDGRRYFDIGGTRADGSEVELDIMEDQGRWRVVETQRDIAFTALPAAVRSAAGFQRDPFAPTRVIESTQEDGIVIYELFGPADGNPQGRKLEIRWDGREAKALTEEWAH